MPKFHGRELFIAYHGDDLSSDINSLDIPWTYDASEVTGFGEASKNYVLGNPDNAIALEGFLNADSDRLHPRATADLGGENERVLAATLGTTPLAIGAAGSGVVVQDYEMTGPVDGPVTVRGTFHVSDIIGIDAVTLLEKTADDTVTGDGSSVDDGSGGGSNAGIRGYLNVFGVTNSPATIALQHGTASSGPWTDLLAFAVATGKTSQGLAASGTVREFLRRNISAGSAEVMITFRRL